MAFEDEARAIWHRITEEASQSNADGVIYDGEKIDRIIGSALLEAFERGKKSERAKDDLADQLGVRFGQLGNWITENALYAQVDQRHLEAGTPERAYWHYGYAVALHDVIRLAKEAK